MGRLLGAEADGQSKAAEEAQEAEGDYAEQTEQTEQTLLGALAVRTFAGEGVAETCAVNWVDTSRADQPPKAVIAEISGSLCPGKWCCPSNQAGSLEVQGNLTKLA